MLPKLPLHTQCIIHRGSLPVLPCRLTHCGFLPKYLPFPSKASLNSYLNASLNLPFPRSLPSLPLPSPSLPSLLLLLPSLRPHGDVTQPCRSLWLVRRELVLNEFQTRLERVLIATDCRDITTYFGWPEIQRVTAPWTEGGGWREKTGRTGTDRLAFSLSPFFVFLSWLLFFSFIPFALSFPLLFHGEF